MLKKYSVEYSLGFNRHEPQEHLYFHTDDPVTCEEFIEELLQHEMRLHSIKRDGIDLPAKDFDRTVMVAGAALAAKRICAALRIKPEEERYRFHFPV